MSCSKTISFPIADVLPIIKSYTNKDSHLFLHEKGILTWSREGYGDLLCFLPYPIWTGNFAMIGAEQFIKILSGFDKNKEIKVSEKNESLCISQGRKRGGVKIRDVSNKPEILQYLSKYCEHIHTIKWKKLLSSKLKAIEVASSNTVKAMFVGNNIWRCVRITNDCIESCNNSSFYRHSRGLRIPKKMKEVILLGDAINNISKMNPTQYSFRRQELGFRNEDGVQVWVPIIQLGIDYPLDFTEIVEFDGDDIEFPEKTYSVITRIKKAVSVQTASLELWEDKMKIKAFDKINGTWFEESMKIPFKKEMKIYLNPDSFLSFLKRSKTATVSKDLSKLKMETKNDVLVLSISGSVE